MRRRPDGLHVALVFLAIVLQGCAASQDARNARSERDMRRAATLLAQRSDADSLAAAGLLSGFQAGPGVALSLLARATAAAPDRADLTWLAIEMCQHAPGCDPEPQEQRLRTLDPSNGAGWLYAIAHSSASLADLARTTRVDIYWTSLVAHLTGALADNGGIPPTDALVDVIGFLGAQSIPAYKTTSDLCFGPQLGDAERLEQCQRVASAFEQGDAYITAMMGAALAKRVWPADSPQWQAAEQSRHVWEYRSEVFARLEQRLMHDPQWVRKFLALCAQNRREQDVDRIELIDAGKSPDPPPGWKSRRP